MIRLFRFLLTGDGHMHKWEIIGQGRRTWDGAKIGDYYNCRCSVCGKIKAFDT